MQRLILISYQKTPNGGDDVARNRYGQAKGSHATFIQSSGFALTSIDLFAAALRFHGGCRRISVFGQRGFHHAQVCLRATFGFTPNGERRLPTKFAAFSKTSLATK